MSSEKGQSWHEVHLKTITDHIQYRTEKLHWVQYQASNHKQRNIKAEVKGLRLKAYDAAL